MKALTRGVANIAQQGNGNNSKIKSIGLDGALTQAEDQRDTYAGVADAAVLLGHSWLLEQGLPEDEYRVSLDDLPSEGKGSARGSYRKLTNERHLFVRGSEKKWASLLSKLGGKEAWFKIEPEH